MPAEIPAEVRTLPALTTCDFESTVTFGKNSRIICRKYQWVVAERPSSNPAWPKMNEPVQTEANVSAFDARERTKVSMASLRISTRAPKPPGTTKISRLGQLSNVTSGMTFIPPVVFTVSLVCDIKNCSKGDDSSRRRSSLIRVTENTSKGPQKSRTSTSSKITIPSFLRFICHSRSCPLERVPKLAKRAVAARDDALVSSGRPFLDMTSD